MNKVNAAIYGNLVTISLIFCGALYMLYRNDLTFDSFSIIAGMAAVACVASTVIIYFGEKKVIKDGVCGTTSSEKNN